VRRAPGSRIVRYGLAVVLVGLALLLSELVHSIIPHSVDYLFLAAIVASGWLGGRGPGLLAAGVAPLVLDYFFLPPLHTLGISPEAGPEVLPFLLSALAAAWVSSMRSTARETRARLERSEEKFRRILTNQPDVAWTGDENGRMIYISPKVADWTGYTSQEIYAGARRFFSRASTPTICPAFWKPPRRSFPKARPWMRSFAFSARTTPGSGFTTGPWAPGRRTASRSPMG